MPRLDQLDIANLPGAEDERYEFKSSATSFQTLKDKLARAASGFWNSGGGLFIVGVDGTGKPDGGLSSLVGRTSTRDWVDQVLMDVSPQGTYFVRLFLHDPKSAIRIAQDQCVIAVEFEESLRAPHMAPDHKYYIRAGAHTVPATHYLVEALWARRRLQRPQLAHSMRLKPEASDIIQLAVLALTEEPAVNVSFTLDPLPEMWKDIEVTFPLRIPLLDRATPFYVDVTTYHAAAERLGHGVKLRVEYEDLARNRYEYTATLDTKSIAPWKIGTPASEQIARSLESIESTFKKIPNAINGLDDEVSQIRNRLDLIANFTFQHAVSGPSAVEQLTSDAKQVLLAAKQAGEIIFSPFLGGSQLYAGSTPFIANPSDAREIARWKNSVADLRAFGLVDGIFKRGVTVIFRFTKLGYEVADILEPTARPPAE